MDGGSEQLDRKRLAEEERQKALAAAAKEQENERQQRITDARNDAQIEFDQILAKARKAYRLSEPAQVEQLTDEICADNRQVVRTTGRHRPAS